MRRYELGMSLNYVRHWGIPEAVREFLQNAMDEQIENPENEMIFDYSEEDRRLTIANKNSVLEINSLLLGKTSKEGKDDLTGQYGEGYKVATIVLLRNNCGVTIYNNKVGEMWEAKKIKSKRYGEEIGVFDITKTTSWFKPKSATKDMNLVVTIDGITTDEFEQVKKNTLAIRDYGKCYSNPEKIYGKVLLDKAERGRVYVNGLYVYTHEGLRFGYDFHSSELPLGRDRDLTRTFNLLFACSTLAVQVCPVSFLKDNLDCKDFSYLTINSFWRSEDVDKGAVLIKEYTDKFIETYGEDVIPVESVNDFNKFSGIGKKAVLLSKTECSFIDLNRLSPVVYSSEELDSRFELWLSRVSGSLILDEIDEIKELWREARSSNATQ